MIFFLLFSLQTNLVAAGSQHTSTSSGSFPVAIPRIYRRTNRHLSLRLPWQCIHSSRHVLHDCEVDDSLDSIFRPLRPLPTFSDRTRELAQMPVYDEKDRVDKIALLSCSKEASSPATPPLVAPSASFLDTTPAGCFRVMLAHSQLTV